MSGVVRPVVAGALLLCLASCLRVDDLLPIQMEVARGGKTDYAIVTGNAPTEAEKYAAEELRTYLGKITGADFKTVAEKDAGGCAKAIYLGWTDYAKTKGVDPAALGREEWVIRTVGSNLIIAGGRPRGTLYGVYEFLEKYGGCAWLGKNTDVIPLKPTCLIPDIDEQSKPAFWYRGIYTADTHGGLPFYVRNKICFHTYGNPKYGYDESPGSPGGCHTFYAYAKDWPTNHPEYFALNAKGERPRSTSASAGQICLSNPDVRKLVLQKLREYIRADRARCAESGRPYPLVYDISPNDDRGECMCPGCKAILEREGAYSGVLLDFINEIARELKKECPDIYIQTFAYTFTLEPPKHIRPEDNVIIRWCESDNMGTQRSVLHGDNARSHESFQNWSKTARHLGVWDYWIYYQNLQFPYVNVSSIQPDLKYFKERGAKLMFVECEEPDTTSFSSLKEWLGYKMMQNPDRPAGDLIAKFIRGYYGPAAGGLQAYLDYLEKRIAESPRPAGWDYLDLPFFIKANALLDKAELTLSAADSLYSLHVRQERVPLDLALLHLWDKLASQLPGNQAMPFSRNAVIERYAKNRGDVIGDYYGGERLKEGRAKLAYEIKFFKAMPIPLPGQFAGMKVVADLLWPDFTPPSSNVDDPVATAGAAHRLGPNPGNKDDKAFHDRPLAMGLYDSTKASEKEKWGPSLALKPEEIPQDGKYHMYKVGRFLPGKRALLWAHWSWQIQLYLRKANAPAVEEEVDVYVSMKALGPAYIKGSRDENSIFIDRVILVSPVKKE